MTPNPLPPPGGTTPTPTPASASASAPATGPGAPPAGPGTIPGKGAPASPTSPQDKQEQELDALEQALDDLTNEVEVAAEWGVFQKPTDEPFEVPTIFKELETASQALKDGKAEDAKKAMRNANAALNDAQNRNCVWKLNNWFGVLPLLITTVSTLLAYLLVFQWELNLSGTDLLHNAAFAGMIGSLLKCLYWLQFQTGRGLFRPRFLATFVVAPYIGIILGWLMSLLVLAGAEVLTGGKAAEPDWRTVTVLALFAGYKWPWALDWLDDAAKSIQSRIKDKDKAPAKTK